jgi:hypothetical protein
VNDLTPLQELTQLTSLSLGGTCKLNDLITAARADLNWQSFT